MSAALFGENEARYAALSGLVHGARVLDLAIHGDGRCIDALVTAGATSITVCAPEQVRRELTTQNVDLQLIQPLALPLDFAPGSFDVVVCFDLIARVAQDPSWMSGLRSVLSPSGAIVVATSSADDAARILGASFGVATVFAQSPLVGHMLYDVAAEELEPELDRTWADGEGDEPMSYVVIFAPEERHNEKLTMVQMPFASWERVAGAELAALRVERDTLRRDLATANETIARNQRQLDELLSRNIAPSTPAEVALELTRHRHDRATLEVQIADLLEESNAANAEREGWQQRVDALEEALVEERSRSAELQGRAEAAEANFAELGRDVAELHARLTEAALHAETQAAALADAAARAEATATPADEANAELERASTLIAELESAAARDHAAVAELHDTIAVERAAATQARQSFDAERDALKRRADELQRALDMSRRRGDELARTLDNDRQQLSELKDNLESERQRANQLEKTQSAKEIDGPTGQEAIDGES